MASINNGPVLEADDIPELPDYDPTETTGTNTTDYTFPDGWGTYSDEERVKWFTQWRVRQMATRQRTTVGEALRKQQAERDRLDTDQYRSESPLE